MKASYWCRETTECGGLFIPQRLDWRPFQAEKLHLSPCSVSWKDVHMEQHYLVALEGTTAFLGYGCDVVAGGKGLDRRLVYPTPSPNKTGQGRWDHLFAHITIYWHHWDSGRCPFGFPSFPKGRKTKIFHCPDSVNYTAGTFPALLKMERAITVLRHTMYSMYSTLFLPNIVIE